MTAVLPLADSYLRIKDKFYRPPQCQFYVYDLPIEHINEKHLHYLWAERLIKPYKNLQTLDGRNVVIIWPGLWNTEDGPDFKESSLQIGPDAILGDVEIHLYSSDWYRHKHHQDHRYDNVILHLVGWSDSKNLYVETAHNRKVPQVVLGNIVESEFEEADRFLEFGKYSGINARFGGLGRCSQFCLNPKFNSLLQQFLKMAAEARLNYKIERFKKMLTIPDYDTLLYESTMEALGYQHNTTAFREISQAVPLTLTRKILPRFPEEERPLVIQSLFLYQGNLIPSLSAKFTAESKKYIAKISEIYDRLSKMFTLSKPLKLSWKIKGTRPLNYPARRLAAAGYWLARSRLTELFSTIKNYYLDEYQTRSNTNLKDNLRKCFTPSLKDDYWLTHTTLTNPPLTKPAALVGKETLLTLEINTFIPLLLLNSSDTAFSAWLVERWKHLSVLTDNSITRFMKYRLFADKTKAGKMFIKTAGDQQALIQIYRDFCAKGFEGCNTCGLMKWFKQV